VGGLVALNQLELEGLLSGSELSRGNFFAILAVLWKFPFDSLQRSAYLHPNRVWDPPPPSGSASFPRSTRAIWFALEPDPAVT
jgi:hypothetical protein